MIMTLHWTGLGAPLTLRVPVVAAIISRPKCHGDDYIND